MLSELGTPTSIGCLAFAGILVSIFLQSTEISETKHDLAEQRSQQQKQVFETAFFQLLQLSNEIVRSSRYESTFTTSTSTGKNCFEAIRNDFVTVSLRSDHWGQSSAERYARFYEVHAHDQLGHYFRNLYQIMKYIDTSDVPIKKFYTNIVRAQLSSHELFLLFYNCLSLFGKEKFFPLLQKYEFFEHLPVTDVLQADAATYEMKAFGNSLEWVRFFNVVASQETPPK